MTNHGNTKAATFATDDQFTPATEAGSVIRFRLEASEVAWAIAPGRTVRGYGFNGQVPGAEGRRTPGVGRRERDEDGSSVPSARILLPVLEINGNEPAWRSMEDVINVPPKATVRIAWYPDDRPGMWMYHCHILEHHAAGMMAHFEVVR
ncbi:MAG TPA: multicopper oxidase domain-containing protein [Vicinamibacterales bacterium]|nr:multicopper oxidase domain-containing protein [Vicinamibacterales bacterium]